MLPKNFSDVAVGDKKALFIEKQDRVRNVIRVPKSRQCEKFADFATFTRR